MTATLVDAPRIPGWFHHGSKILELVEQYRPRVCVELGTWLGASAVPVARSIQRWGGTLACVDTWSGELNEDGGSAVNKPPVMLFGAARAMVDAGVSANVRLIVATTADAAKVWSGPIDFLYIDADHSEDGVTADLEAWVPHVKPGGLIVGDDYGNAIFPGVKRAWDAFENAHGLTLTRFQSDPPATQGVQLIYGPTRDAGWCYQHASAFGECRMAHLVPPPRR
jgi:predicted O-methyltransferase YrrM